MRCRRRLRHRHRLLTRLLALLLPLGCIAAIAGRTPPTATASAPDPAGQWTQEGPAFTGPGQAELLELRYAANDDHRTHGALVVRRLPALQAPDILLYWLPADTPPGQDLPDNAYLLGQLGGARASFTLPPIALTQAGGLLLYSLAQKQVLAAGDLPGYPFKGKGGN